jgi:hypothetical protein
MLKKGPQHLTPELVAKFNSHKDFKGAYSNLLKVVKDENHLQKWYSRSTNAKFLIATGIPVLLIAFGTPTFNQWLTRRKLAKEQGQNQQLPPTTPMGGPLGQTMPTSAAQAPTTPVFSTLAPMNANSGFPSAQTYAQPRVSPFASFGAPASNMSVSQPSVAQPQFAGLGGIASSLLQNERYNTLLVDGVISGGRTYKARNWTERMEIIFREALLIVTLYFAQAPIQKFFSGLFDKKPDMHTQLQFDTMKHLNQVYGQNSSKFEADYRKSMERFMKLMDVSESELFHNTKELEYIQNFRWVKRLINPQKVAQLENMEAKLEAKLVSSVHNYFLEGKSGDLFFETAKSCGWIPTFEKDGVKMLSLTQKIKMQPILRMSDAFSKVNEDLVKLLTKTSPMEAEKLFGKMMKKSMSGRFGAMMLANGVCFTLLSILGPLVQHKITKRTTGQDYFPGVRADQDAKSSVKLLNMA